jgi:hypothetical protein
LARYSARFTVATAAAGAPLFSVRAGLARAKIRQIKVTNTDGAANQQVAIGRPATSGTPSGSGIVPQPTENANDAAALTSIDTTWTSAPTFGGVQPIRGATLGTAIGAGQILADVGQVDPSSQWTAWNAGSGATGTLEVEITIEE